MSDQSEKSFATRFLDEHPALREAMARSQKLTELKKRLALPKDDETDAEEEQLYTVRGDTVGDEDELYVDALVRGSNPDSQDKLAREVFLETDLPLQALIIEKLR